MVNNWRLVSPENRLCREAPAPFGWLCPYRLGRCALAIGHAAVALAGPCQKSRALRDSPEGAFCVVLEPTFELADGNESHPAKANEAQRRLDVALEAVEAHADRLGSLFTRERKTRNRGEIAHLRIPRKRTPTQLAFAHRSRPPLQTSWLRQTEQRGKSEGATPGGSPGSDSPGSEPERTPAARRFECERCSRFRVRGRRGFDRFTTSRRSR